MRSREEGWPDDVVWHVGATREVAAACLSGTGLAAALRALADERLDKAATLDDFERDAGALASCVAELSPRTVEPEQLLAAARHAGRQIVAGDHVLAHLFDPVTELRSRTAFLSDLTSAGYHDEHRYVWIARWQAEKPPWSAATTRVTIASHLRSALGPRDSAAYLGPCCLAVLLTVPERGGRLAEVVHGVAAVEISLTECPDAEWPELARWLVDTFPELVDEFLP